MTEPKQIRLTDRVVCPHCWYEFPPEEVHWIATGATPEYNKTLDAELAPRFLPTRFDVEGNALDAQGRPTRRFACPHCAMELPESCLSMRPIFASVVGGPASGKSFWLASALRALRRNLPPRFFLELEDSALPTNAALLACDATFDGDRDPIDLGPYRAVRDAVQTLKFESGDVPCVSPLAFATTPASVHPKYEKARKVERTICLYDSGGAAYLPEDVAEDHAVLATKHLAHSRAIFFMFDPTQCDQMRDALKKISNDPQLEEFVARRRSMVSQEAVLEETVRRVRKFRNLRPTEKSDALLIVLLGKCDVCQPALVDADFTEPLSRGVYDGVERSLLRVDRIERMSESVRAYLAASVPKFVETAESAFDKVVYIPTSATGVSPSVDPESLELLVPARAARPVWIEIPLLYMLSKTIRGCLPARE